MANGKRSLATRGRGATGAEDHMGGSNLGDLGPARQAFDRGGRMEAHAGGRQEL